MASKKTPVIAVVDTTFSTVNMGKIAVDELKKSYPKIRVIRHTVPGFKDLAVECQRLLKDGADIALALGMVGSAPIDTQCAHEASIGVQMAKMNTNKHIIEVFVHMKESEREDGSIDEQDLLSLTEDRVRKHAHNAVWLLISPEKLVERAGTGRRQGREDVGPAQPERRGAKNS
ncbi:Riboflavin synthase [uncultured archaeon]|nr:Riboflavin synthase [uncultured archaeon]